MARICRIRALLLSVRQARDSPINPSVFEIFSPETSMSDTRFISSLGACILALSLTLAACGGGGGSSDTGSGGVADKPIAPSITTPPASQSVVAGKTATFSVVATGSATLAYQWKKNGADISGATYQQLTPHQQPAAPTTAPFFWLASATALAQSPAAAQRLRFQPPQWHPVISTQPVNQSVVVGQSATFTVICNGRRNNHLPMEEKRHRH